MRLELPDGGQDLGVDARIKRRPHRWRLRGERPPRMCTGVAEQCRHHGNRGIEVLRRQLHQQFEAQPPARPDAEPYLGIWEEELERMAARIARHRSERPREWLTIEEPLALCSALARAPAQALVIIDCLTLWVANLLGSGTDERAIEALAQEAAAAAARRTAPVIAVGNELGMGLVPADPYSRRFRDLHGRVNAIWVAHAEHASLVVAGALIALGRGDDMALLPATEPQGPAPEAGQ